MAYMVSTALSVHHVKRIEARSSSEASLTLAFQGDPDASTEQFNMAEVTVFMDDHALVERLIEAINDVSRHYTEVDQAVEGEQLAGLRANVERTRAALEEEDGKRFPF